MTICFWNFQLVLKSLFGIDYLYFRYWSCEYNIWLNLIVSRHQLMIFPQRSSGNVPEYSFGRISWNLPRHTLTKRFILLVNLYKTGWVWGTYCVNNFCCTLIGATDTWPNVHMPDRQKPNPPTNLSKHFDTVCCFIHFFFRISFTFPF